MSNPHPADQIRYCERCGISFLWTTEEQKEMGQKEMRQKEAEQNGARHDAPPTHCPGCRLLLPAFGRERGLVKWYNRRKRFGFLVRRDHPEIFAHGSDLQGATALHPGDLVEFSVAHGERGLAAKEIVVIDQGEAPTAD